MKRFFANTSHSDVMDETPNGEYVLYEDVEPIVADRDIKAANLQLLVEKVLMWEVQDSAFQVAPELTPHFNELFALARSLKQ